MSPAKALAILSYGESVAAYRYRILAERTAEPALKTQFQEMADEEQGHNEAVQAMLARHFPDADFVLTPEDKALVTVGTRLLDLAGPDSLHRAMEQIHASELLTGRIYAILGKHPPAAELEPVMQAMAEECFEHAQRLTRLAPGGGPDR